LIYVIGSTVSSIMGQREQYTIFDIREYIRWIKQDKSSWIKHQLSRSKGKKRTFKMKINLLFTVWYHSQYHSQKTNSVYLLMYFNYKIIKLTLKFYMMSITLID